MKKIFRLIQPFLIAIAPLIVFFRNNPGEIFFFDFLIVSSFVAITISLLTYTASRWIKDKEKVSIAISIFCLSLILSAEFVSTDKLLIWCICTLSALISFKFPIPFKLKAFLSYSLSIPLLVVISYNILQIGLIKKTIRQEIFQQHLTSLPSKSQLKTCSRDIYIIILDEFISEQAFKNYYHFNNDFFFDYLRENNFYLVSSSTSNYPWTITSISSILNFDYHNTDLSKNVFTGVAQNLIEHNQLFKILKEEGYCINHIPSIYWMGNPSQNLFSDFLLRTKSYGLVQTLSQITPLKDFYRTYQRNSHREHVLNQLEQLKQISEKPGKNLVFAHIMSPHRPIAFTDDGSNLSEQEVLLAEKDPQHLFYLGQAKFISKEVIKTIDHILKHSSEYPIILILSDHGKFPIGCNPKGKPTLPLNEIAWRFSNLQALHLPHFDQSFSDKMTPINTVRILLNHYFGYEIPIVEDACCPHFYDLKQRIPNELVLDNLFLDITYKQ
jgi:hypothetical protein